MNNGHSGGCASAFFFVFIRLPLKLLSLVADMLVSIVYHILAGIGHIVRFIWSHGRRKAHRTLDSISDALEFEEYVADLLRANGYRHVEVTRKTGDYGVDILAHLGRERYAIQCKLYSSPVGNKAVQEAYAGKAHYGCDVAVVATNNTFTKAAYEMAETTGTLLWDYDDLIRLNRRGFLAKSL